MYLCTCLMYVRVSSFACYIILYSFISTCTTLLSIIQYYNYYKVTHYILYSRTHKHLDTISRVRPASFGGLVAES